MNSQQFREAAHAAVDESMTFASLKDSFSIADDGSAQS